ncbi:hypothetical protein PO909_015091 [Leuciscus waleckii]
MHFEKTRLGRTEKPDIDPPSSVLLPDALPPVRSSTTPPRPYTGTLRPSLTTTTTTTMAPPRRHNNILPEALTRSPPSLQTPVAVDYCAPRLTAEISWPRTHQGQVAKQPCPPGTIGVATFNCLLGYWNPKGPDLSNCTSPWTNHITQRMRSGETAAIVARELAEQTKGELRPGDVPSTVKAMAQLVELLDVQLRNLTPGGKDTAARSLNKAMVETVNNLLQVRSQAAWRELSVTEQLRCATMLLDTVETGAFMLADNLLKTDTIQESTDNILELLDNTGKACLMENTHMDRPVRGSATYGIILGWLQSEMGKTTPDSDGRAHSAKGKTRAHRRELVMEGYAYGIAAGITTYGTQPSTSYTSIQALGLASDAPQRPTAKGYGGTLQGSPEWGTRLEQKAHVSAP